MNKEKNKIYFDALKKNLLMRGIKIIDIFFVGIIFFTISYIMSRLIDNWMGPFNVLDNIGKSKLRMEFEVAIHIISLYVITYIARNIVEIIPFPLDGAFGYEHARLKELSSGAIFFFVLVSFQTHLYDKILYLSKK